MSHAVSAATHHPGGTSLVELPHRGPFDAGAWFRHVADRAIPGLERAEVLAAPGPHAYAVTRIVHGVPGEDAVVATVLLSADGTRVEVRLEGGPLAAHERACGRLRRWLDLDIDPAHVAAALGDDPLIGPLLATRPGLRVPGTCDPFELAVRAVLGQQVSTAAARTVAGRLVAAYGSPGPRGLLAFPSPARLAGLPVAAMRELGLNTGRASTVGVLARAVLGGLPLEPGPDVDPARVRAQLLALPGIGPWTVDYVELRAWGGADVFPAGDLVLRRALAELPGGTGAPVDVRATAAHALRWSPWRGYAAQHLWSAWSARAPRVRAVSAGG
ncbi:DNA-3-methyladenine glycosylase 2 [Cellulomonas sp. P22]|uniref:DNA-3-methyladenine glycosylase 2 n=1 Tax=Cellulomonas sp. P22 TaxID=3373189 RepID=UPI00379250F2